MPLPGCRLAYARERLPARPRPGGVPPGTAERTQEGGEGRPLEVRPGGEPGRHGDGLLVARRDRETLAGHDGGGEVEEKSTSGGNRCDGCSKHAGEMASWAST